MSNINEALRSGDLRMLVNDIIEIDSFASKMGEDQDIVVVAFTVEYEDPANDLVKFLEHGYDFILDSDASPGELSDGKYKVFVEIERNRRIAQQIAEMLNGVKELTKIDNFKFRYYKSFKSIPATEENLEKAIPKSKDEYTTSIKENRLNNFSNFFNKSFVESITVANDVIRFNKAFAGPLSFKIVDAGNVTSLYKALPGKIMIESSSIAEVLFLTKYIGNYNITKVGDYFVLENERFAVALEKING